MTDAIEGIKLPSLPNATVRKKIPTPYARPSITIGAGRPPGERREWRTVLACDIEADDIVPGVGRVYAVDSVFECPVWTVTVEGGVGNRRSYQGNEQVWVFTTRHAPA